MTTINVNNQWKLEKKIELVKSGKSRVFEEWKLYGGITEEEFIEALRWLAEDPMTEKENSTREISIIPTQDAINKVWIEKGEPWSKMVVGYDENNLKTEIIKIERLYEVRYDEDGKPYDWYLGRRDIKTGYGTNAKFFIDINDRI